MLEPAGPTLSALAGFALQALLWGGCLCGGLFVAAWAWKAWRGLSLDLRSELQDDQVEVAQEER